MDSFDLRLWSVKNIKQSTKEADGEYHGKGDEGGGQGAFAFHLRGYSQEENQEIFANSETSDRDRQRVCRQHDRDKREQRESWRMNANGETGKVKKHAQE
jgi:hypothetical protein